VKKHKEKKAGNKSEDMWSICFVFSLLCLDIKPNLLLPSLTFDKVIFSVGFYRIFHALFENVYMTEHCKFKLVLYWVNIKSFPDSL